MKIKILKNVVAKAQPQKVGTVLELDAEEASLLIGYGDAEESSKEETKKPGKSKKN